MSKEDEILKILQEHYPNENITKHNLTDVIYNKISKNLRHQFDEAGWHLCPVCGSEMSVNMTIHPTSGKTLFHLRCSNEDCPTTFGYEWNYYTVSELIDDWNTKQKGLLIWE